MKNIHTHYDNLKVSRNAPPEVIKAAYKSLSQKYHPDKNPENSEAGRIMAILNNSYDVLSNPEKRKLHDIWISQQEEISNPIQNDLIETNSKSSNQSGNFKKSAQKYTYHITYFLIRYGLGLSFVFFIIWAVFFDDNSSTPTKGPKPYQSNPPSEIPTYTRPSCAPNGKPWPIKADYVFGYEKLKTKGLSSVTIDNTGNDSDVFVKLVALDEDKAYPVRQFYIPAYEKFTLNKISIGNYDIRYRDLSTGLLSRSESFYLEETTINDRIQYSNFTMTLFKVQDGNMHTYNLSETEF